MTFSVSVPNEKQVPVTDLKLDIPKGLAEVTPTVKNNWTISTASDAAAKDPQVTSITWADGTIPAGQRDDFSFSAQVPAKATELDWRAYQTYGDGSVVHWDQKPAGSNDSSGDAGPYSVTQVADDLAKPAAAKPASTTNTTGLLALVLSLAAIVISTGSLLFKKGR